jgi:hypothetical protein
MYKSVDYVKNNLVRFSWRTQYKQNKVKNNNKKNSLEILTDMLQTVQAKL